MENTEKASRLYGLPTPRNQEEILLYQITLFEWAKSAEEAFDRIKLDEKPFIRVPSAQALIAVRKQGLRLLIISEIPSGHCEYLRRHREFYPQVAEAFQKQTDLPEAVFSNLSPVPWSRIEKKGNEFRIIHPSFSHQFELKN